MTRMADKSSTVTKQGYLVEDFFDQSMQKQSTSTRGDDDPLGYTDPVSNCWICLRCSCGGPVILGVAQGALTGRKDTGSVWGG